MNPYFAENYGRSIEVLGSQQHKNVTQLAALFVDKDASHVLIRNNEFSNAAVGVRVRGSHSVVTHNYFHDAAKITEQWGAIAIAIVGPHSATTTSISTTTSRAM